MKYQHPKYEFPIEGIAFTGKPGEPAAIYLLNGNWHLAPLDSVAEMLLNIAGGLHIATLTFPTTAFNPGLN